MIDLHLCFFFLSFQHIPQHLEPDQYNLYVTSDGDVNFDDFTQLQYHVLTISTFIQTDKPIYKPGEIGIAITYTKIS